MGQGLGGEGGPDASAREVRVPLPNGYLPRSAMAMGEGLGGEGVPAGAGAASDDPPPRASRRGRRGRGEGPLPYAPTAVAG